MKLNLEDLMNENSTKKKQEPANPIAKRYR